MTNISEIYKKYKIMPSLQLHQLRVAAVAKLVGENMNVEINLDGLIKACLLHDMGNIIKFKLDLFPEFLEPEGLKYWESVKQDFINKYGNDEHTATYKIAKLIGLNSREMEILKSIGFSKAIENLEHDDYTRKIACYSDHRVSPNGIKSLNERIIDGKERFKGNKGIRKDSQKLLEDFEKFSNGMRTIEKQIFNLCRIKPEDISDESIKQNLEGLDNYNI